MNTVRCGLKILNYLNVISKRLQFVQCLLTSKSNRSSYKNLATNTYTIFMHTFLPIIIYLYLVFYERST